MRQRVRVRVPSGAPCKDDYFDTMSIEVIVLTFCPKPLKIADFITLLRKASPLTRQRTGLEAVLFCFSGVIRGWAIVDLCGIIILLGLSLDRYKATVPRELVLSIRKPPPTWLKFEPKMVSYDARYINFKPCMPQTKKLHSCIT